MAIWPTQPSTSPMRHGLDGHGTMAFVLVPCQHYMLPSRYIMNMRQIFCVVCWHDGTAAAQRTVVKKRPTHRRPEGRKKRWPSRRMPSPQRRARGVRHAAGEEEEVAVTKLTCTRSSTTATRIAVPGASLTTAPGTPPTRRATDPVGGASSPRLHRLHAQEGCDTPGF